MSTELHALRIDRSQKSARPSRGRGLTWIALLLVVLAIGGGWVYLRAAAPMAVGVVRVALVQAVPLDDVVLNATGYVVAAHKIELAPKVNGRTAWVGVDMGDKVKKGQELVRLEDEEFQAQVKQQQGQLDSAKALLEQYMDGSLPEEIAQSKAQLDNAKANLIDATANLARLVEAIKTKSVSQQSLDDAQASFDRAKATIALQQAQYDLAVKGPRKELIQAQRAVVEQAQGILDLMNVNLHNTVIRSPIDGTVLDRNVEVGEFVTTGFVGDNGAKGYVVSLADLNDLRVELDISQNDFNKIGADSRCSISTDAYPDRKYAGKVDQISPQANRQKATILVKVKILQPDDLLRPDMNATVSFLRPAATQPTQQEASAIFIPASAVHDGNVLVIEDGKATRRAIKVGSSGGSNVRVNEGLAAGDLVIIDAPANLQAGQAVSARDSAQ